MVAEKSAALRIEPVHNAAVRPVDGGCGHLVAAIAHIRCAALLLPARTTMLTTYGSRGPVLACLFAQATAFFGLSLNEHSDMLMASETVLFSSFTSEDDPHIDLKRMASGSAWSMSHALWGTARRSGRQGAWACACRGDMHMYKSRVAEYDLPGMFPPLLPHRRSTNSLPIYRSTR